MKPNQIRKKTRLLLSKEKVRDLSKHQLEKVAGGRADGGDDSICSFTPFNRA